MSEKKISANSSKNSEMASEPESYKSDYRESLALAEAFEKVSWRSSVYFYEEAYLQALDVNNRHGVTTALEKLGRLLNESGDWQHSSLFYSLIFKNTTLRLAFGCQSSGMCCRDFKINMNLHDIKRIKENKPELKISDFVVFPEGSKFEPFLEKNENFIQANKEWPFYLQKKTGSDECIFLENNMCGIHAFKPLSCRNWPMQLTMPDRIVFAHTLDGYLDNRCGYCLEPTNNQEAEIKKNLRTIINDFLHSKKVLEKVSNIFLEKGEKYSAESIVNFSLDILEQQERLITAFAEEISREHAVKRVSLSFFINLGKLPGIITYTDEPEKVLEKLKKSFNQYNFKSSKKVISVSDKNEELLLLVFKEPGSLKDIPLIDERVLYNTALPEEGYSGGELNLPLSDSLLDEILYAARKSARYYAKAGKAARESEIISNLLRLPESHKRELSLMKVRETFAYLQGTEKELLQDLKKIMADKETGYSDYMLITLKLLNSLEDPETEEVLNLLLDNAITEADYSKIIRLLPVLKIGFSEETRVKLCNFLLKIYESAAKENNYEMELKILELFFNYYTTGLLNKSYSFLYEKLSVTCVKNGETGKAMQYIQLALTNITEPAGKLEFYINIADAFLDEEDKEEAALYCEKALGLAQSLTRPDEELFLSEILLNLYTETREYTKALKAVSRLSGLYTTHDLSEQKKLLILKEAKIRYLSARDSNDFPDQLVKKNKQAVLDYLKNENRQKELILPAQAEHFKIRLLKTRLSLFKKQEYLHKLMLSYITGLLQPFERELLDFSENSSVFRDFLEIRLYGEFGETKKAEELTGKLLAVLPPGSEQIRAFCLAYLGLVQMSEKNYAGAESLFSEALANFQHGSYQQMHSISSLMQKFSEEIKGLPVKQKESYIRELIISFSS